MVGVFFGGKVVRLPFGQSLPFAVFFGRMGAGRESFFQKVPFPLSRLT
jgi:hypothetical protein